MNKINELAAILIRTIYHTRKLPVEHYDAYEIDAFEWSMITSACDKLTKAIQEEIDKEKQ
jgi:hypothetical protein